METSILLPITYFCACLGIILPLILVRFNKRNVFANRLLALSIFALAWVWILDILYQTNWVRSVPHFHRVQHPLHFLVAPCGYLYVRSLIYNESRFRTYDWIHFIPFLLHSLELMPFYLSSAAEKLDILDAIQQNPELLAVLPEGMLPPYGHLYLKALIGLIYMFFQWRLVLYYRRTNRPSALQHNERLRKWLTGYTGLMTLLFFTLLITLSWNFTSLQTYLVIRIAVGLNYLFVLVYLLLHPSILYGLHPYAIPMQADSGKAPIAGIDSKDSILSPDQVATYNEFIDRYIKMEHPYLQLGFSLSDMAEELDIPRHHLSAFINEHYQKNFNDFINGYRIQHILDHFGAEKWLQLSLEGIGLEAGFRSRSTFYKAFKKYTGERPSEYRSLLLDRVQAGKRPSRLS